MTKTYKKTNKNTLGSITSIDKKIAQDLRLNDRIEVSASRDAFITLKDHKTWFYKQPNMQTAANGIARDVDRRKFMTHIC